MELRCTHFDQATTASRSSSSRRPIALRDDDRNGSDARHRRLQLKTAKGWKVALRLVDWNEHVAPTGDVILKSGPSSDANADAAKQLHNVSPGEQDALIDQRAFLVRGALK